MIEAVAHPQRSVVREAVAYLLAVAAAEAVTMFLHPLWGLIGHAVIMVTAIVRAARTDDIPYQRLMLSLALVPLIRVVDLSLSISLVSLPAVGRFAIVYAPLLAASVAVVRTLGYKWREVGLNLNALPIQLGIASSGLLFGWAEYLILKPGAMITQLTWSQVLPLAFALLVFTGFVEEFTFRGVLQRSATGVFGWRGIVYVSVLFAILHMGFHSVPDVLFVFGLAMFFGWVVKKTGSILGVTLAHGLTNIMMFLVFPFFG
jgi:membrane protease YdiL (CAAX protease family)